MSSFQVVSSLVSEGSELRRAGSTVGSFVHQVAKPVSIVSVVVLSAVGAALFGASVEGTNELIYGAGLGRLWPGALSTVKTYFHSHLTVLFVLAFAVAIGAISFLPVVVFEMWWYRKESGQTWYERYKDTPGVVLLQVVYAACFWMDVVHIVILLAENICSICSGDKLEIKTAQRSWDSEPIESMFRVVYWIHVWPSLFIAVLGPLQFWPSIRKLKEKAIHRWIGRFLLTASLFHQTAATLMMILQLKSSNFQSHHTNRAAFVFYITSLLPYNVYAWRAIIVGWRAAIQRDIPLHGAMMHRLGIMWFGSAIGFRVFPMFLVPLFYAIGGKPLLAWTGGVSGWIIFIVSVCSVELYLKKSGRFSPGAAPPRCPFLELEA